MFHVWHPQGISDYVAGPVMCSASTVYTSIKESQLRPGNWAVFPGGGGGVGIQGVQLASAMGLRPIVVDSGEEKKKLAMIWAQSILSISKMAILSKKSSNLQKAVHTVCSWQVRWSSVSSRMQLLTLSRCASISNFSQLSRWTCWRHRHVVSTQGFLAVVMCDIDPVVASDSHHKASSILTSIPLPLLSEIKPSRALWSQVWPMLMRPWILRNEVSAIVRWRLGPGWLWQRSTETRTYGCRTEQIQWICTEAQEWASGRVSLDTSQTSAGQMTDIR